MIHFVFRIVMIAVSAAIVLAPALAEEPASNPHVAKAELPASITPTDYLLLPPVGQYGRIPLQRDA